MKYLLTLCFILMIALTACKTRKVAEDCYKFSERQLVEPDSVSRNYTIGIKN